MKNSNNEKLSGVTVYANLNFDNHLENILRKASKKVQRELDSIFKRELLMNSFFTA